MQIISSETTETHTIVKYISDKNNFITVRRPILTEEERARRMEEIKRAAVRLVVETEKVKRQKGESLWGPSESSLLPRVSSSC